MATIVLSVIIVVIYSLMINFRLLNVAIFKMVAVATPTTCHRADKYFVAELNLPFHVLIYIFPTPMTNLKQA